MPHDNQPRPSFIQKLLRGKSRKQKDDEAADRALDEALSHLARAMDENSIASARVRKRQSSGSLKLLSLPEPSFEARE